VNAQEINDSIKLKEVEIIDKRIKKEAALIRKSLDTIAMKNVSTESLAELIKNNSGIHIKSYGRGSSASASFRGTASSHTQVNWNGVNLNSPMRGDVDFSLIPVFFMDGVDLLMGSGSIIDQSGGLGGSIRLNNKADWSKSLSISYSQIIESFNTYKEFLKLEFGNNKFKSVSRLLMDQSQNDFPYYNYGVLPYRDDVQKQADYNKKGILQEFYYQINPNNILSAKIWYYDSFRNLPQLMTYEGGKRVEQQDDINQRYLISWNHYKENYDFSYLSAFSKNDLHYFRSSTENDFVNFDSYGNEESFFNTFTFNYKKWNNHSLLIKGQINYHQVGIENKVNHNNYEHHRFEASPVLQLNGSLNNNIAYFTILRSEYYDNSFIPLIPSIGFVFTNNKLKNASAKISLGRNYHKPGLNDLYWIPGGNPELKPEDGYSIDLMMNKDWNFDRNQINWNTNVYCSLIDNWIVWHPSSTGATYWEASNLKQVFSRGVESRITHKYSINKFQLQSSINYALTLTSNTHAASSVDESRNKQLIYIPKHKGGLLINMKYKNINTTWSSNFTGRRYTQSSNQESEFEQSLNPYIISDLNCNYTYQIKKFRISTALKIHNIFNTEYMAVLWRAMPGRYYSLNLKIAWDK
jgi:iron complex outermembrane receptor protein